MRILIIFDKNSWNDKQLFKNILKNIGKNFEKLLWNLWEKNLINFDKELKC